MFFLVFLFCNSFFVIHCHFAYPFLRFYSHVCYSVIALYRIKSNNKLACIFLLKITPDSFTHFTTTLTKSEEKERVFAVQLSEASILRLWHVTDSYPVIPGLLLRSTKCMQNWKEFYNSKTWMIRCKVHVRYFSPLQLVLLSSFCKLKRSKSIWTHSADLFLAFNYGLFTFPHVTSSR